MAATTKDNIILIAPELSTASDPLFTLILADVALSISTDIVPEAYQEIIQRYLAAHKVAESSGATGGGTTGGPVTREKMKTVEREYASGSDLGAYGLALGSTKYGLEFMRLYYKYRYVRIG